VGLHDKNVRPANGFVDATVNLTVSEFAKIRLRKLDSKLVRDVRGERGVAATRDDNHAALGEGLHGASVSANRVSAKSR
jgi:hypothetical protein